MDNALSAAMAAIIGVFRMYSEKEGNKNTLNKAEMKLLLSDQFGPVPEGKQADVEKIFKNIDDNKDEELNFEEFMIFVVAMTMSFNAMLEKMD